MAEPDYYALLGIASNATADQVRAAFHDVARRYHPDRFSGHAEDERSKAGDIYRRAAEAYRVLMDSAERVRYDAGLARGEVRLGPAPVETGGRPPPAMVTSIKNPKARPFWQKAQESIKAGDFKAAKLNLTLAKNADPDNPMIEAALADVLSKLAPR
jgi:DnaJ-class molecular chaperone